MEPVKAEGRVPTKERIAVFFGCCKLRIIFDDGNYALIGRGSGHLLIRLSIFLGGRSEGAILNVGNFCEAAVCQIQIGGEHSNEKIFNNTLSAMPLVRRYLFVNNITAHQAFCPQPTLIGHGVILSNSCLVNSGAQIGDGAVIGSGAVVTRSEIPRWAIAAGVPARRIKDRISPSKQEIADALQWWNWDLDFFCRNVHLLLDAETHHKVLLNTRVMADDRYNLVIRMKGSGRADVLDITLVAIEDAGRTIPIRETSLRFQNYFSQMTANDEQVLQWMPNPFCLLED